MLSFVDNRRPMPALRIGGTLLCSIAVLLPLGGCGGDGLRKIRARSPFAGNR